MIAFPLVLLWLFIAFGAMRIQVDIIKDEPSEMPGGGPWIVVLRSFLWPLVAVFALIALVVIGVQELLG